MDSGAGLGRALVGAAVTGRNKSIRKHRPVGERGRGEPCEVGALEWGRSPKL